MTKIKEIYKCNVCGNIVEVLHVGVGELVCCNESMQLMSEKNRDEGEEKHVPVVEKLPANVCQGKDGFRVRVGEDKHPSTKDHYIEWIEINTTDGKSGKKFLNPEEDPEVDFYTRKEVKSIRSYCNIHGLWKKDVV